VLHHVGVYDKDNKPCIEELAQEGTLDDGSLLLRHGIFTNPAYEKNDDLLQDGVDHDDDDGNGEGKELGQFLIIDVVKADRLAEDDFAVSILRFINFILLVLGLPLGVAEALHGAGVQSDFALLLNSVVDNILINCVSHPGWSSVGILVTDFFTVWFWIFLFHGQGCFLSGVDKGE